MAEEEEVLMEVEAVEAVYGDDCEVIQRFPPHLTVHIKPRTADDSSQQFVEAVLEFRSSSQYPSKPPHVNILEAKGLDEIRRKILITSVQEKASELSSYLMLVALCEEAVEMLSKMNHPDGNCPLCLYPLVKEGAQVDILPFMKLMSCFHCFHSICIIRWWNWLQEQSESNTSILSNASGTSSSSSLGNQNDLRGTGKENEGNCPVCRKVFHATDVEHVLNLAETYTSELNSEGTEAADEELLQSEAEKLRRLNFEALLKAQEDKKGLIEPKKIVVVQPGMFLPEPVTLPTVSSKHMSKQQTLPPRTLPTSETGSSGSVSKAQRSNHRNHMRKNKSQNPRVQNRQWIKKENSAI